MRVLIVEDTWPIAAVYGAALHREGMVTEIAVSGADAVAKKRVFQPDVVLVDLDLPDLDGLQLVETLARGGDCGVIVVTVDDGEATRVAGLDNGADDFLTKPVKLKELAARIRAVGRRSVRMAPRAVPDTRIRIDLARRCLTGPGPHTTILTEAELAVLEALLDAEGTAISREWLGRLALKRTLHEADRSVDQLVMKLRRKLAHHGLAERAVLSTRGLGYTIPEPERFERPRRRSALLDVEAMFAQTVIRPTPVLEPEALMASLPAVAPGLPDQLLTSPLQP